MKSCFSSIPFLANWGTKTVHFLIVPVINMLFLLFINMQFHQQLIWQIAVASILMSGALSAIDCLVSSFTTDRNLGIDREMIVKQPFSTYYWGTKILTSIFVAMILILINLLLLLFTGCPIKLIILAIKLMPLVICSGLVIGFITAVGAWHMNNPYFWSNLVSMFGYVFSGALIVITSYPQGLQIISKLFPFANTLGIIHNAETKWWNDLFLDSIWLILGMLIYVFQVRRIRTRARTSAL